MNDNQSIRKQFTSGDSLYYTVHVIDGPKELVTSCRLIFSKTATPISKKN